MPEVKASETEQWLIERCAPPSTRTPSSPPHLFASRGVQRHCPQELAHPLRSAALDGAVRHAQPAARDADHTLAAAPRTQGEPHERDRLCARLHKGRVVGAVCEYRRPSALGAADRDALTQPAECGSRVPPGRQDHLVAVAAAAQRVLQGGVQREPDVRRRGGGEEEARAGGEGGVERGIVLVLGVLQVGGEAEVRRQCGA